MCHSAGFCVCLSNKTKNQTNQPKTEKGQKGLKNKQNKQNQPKTEKGQKGLKNKQTNQNLRCVALRGSEFPSANLPSISEEDVKSDFFF